MTTAEYDYPTHYYYTKSGLKIAFIDTQNTHTNPTQLLPILCFVHGITSNAMVWERNIAVLQKYYRCIAIDLLGHGLSDKPDINYTLDFYAQTIIELMQYLAMDTQKVPVYLVAHSMGGQIAVKLVTQYAHPFQKLVLVAPAGFEHFTLSEKLILEQLTTNNGLINQIQYYKFILQMKDYFYELNEKEYQKLTELNRHFYDLKQNPNLTITLESSIKAMLQEPILALLPKIKLPTLVFFGKNDKLIPNKLLHHTLSTAYIAQSACKRIKDVKLLLYDKCGHFLPYEYPAKFNIDLHKFITNLDATQEA